MKVPTKGDRDRYYGEGYNLNPGPAEQRRSGCAIFLAMLLSWSLVFAVVAIISLYLKLY